MSLTLRILDGTGHEHVLTTDTGLQAASYRYTEEMDGAADGGGEIRLGHLSLTLSEGGRLMGAASRDELPPPSVTAEGDGDEVGLGQGGYRAVLTRATDAGEETILEGVVPRVEIAHDVESGVWTAPLTPATEDFWARLAAVHLDRLGAAVHDAIPAEDIPYVYAEGSPAGRRYLPSTTGTYRWYDLLALCEAVIAAADGVMLEGDLPDLFFSVRLRVNTLPRTITRPFRPHVFSLGAHTFGRPIAHDNPTLPAWTGKDLLENTAAALGWRLSAHYAPYPSRDVIVRVTAVGAPLPEPEGLPALDGHALLGGYTRRAEPAPGGGTALRHANGLAETSPMPVMPRDALDAVAPGTIPSVPPALAVLAQTVWRFDERPGPRAEDQAEPVARRTVDTGFRLPMLAPTIPHALGIHSLDGVTLIDPSAPEAGEVTERVYYGLPVREDADLEPAYLGIPVLTPQGMCLLWAREVLEEPGIRLGTGQHRLVNPVWARELYQLQSRTFNPTEIADGDFALPWAELPAAGESVALEGRAWRLLSRTVDVESEAARLVLGRPEPATAHLPASPDRPGPVRDLSGAFHVTRAAREGTQNRVVLVRWRPPAAPALSVYRYEVEIDHPDGLTLRQVTRATGTLYDGAEGGKSYTFRVRAVGERLVMEGGDPINGPWSEITVTIEGEPGN